MTPPSPPGSRCRPTLRECIRLARWHLQVAPGRALLENLGSQILALAARLRARPRGQRQELHRQLEALRRAGSSRRARRRQLEGLN